MTLELERPTTIRVAVAAGASMLCDALSTRLSDEGDLHAIGVPGQSASAETTIGSLMPDVVVVDSATCRHEEASFVERLRSLPGAPSVVALVSAGDASLASRFIAAGASGVVQKSAPSTELVGAVRWSANGAGWISPELLRNVLNEIGDSKERFGDEQLKQLTKREREILQLMVDGLGRKQMSERLWLSIDTIRTHMRTIMEKLDVHSATEAVSVALTAGLRPSAA